MYIYRRALPCLRPWGKHFSKVYYDKYLQVLELDLIYNKKVCSSVGTEVIAPHLPQGDSRQSWLSLLNVKLNMCKLYTQQEMEKNDIC